MSGDIRKCICVTLLALMSVGLYSQDMSLLDRAYAQMSSSCMKIEYDYNVVVSGVKNVGDGVLELQGHRWTMNGNGLTMCCDSSSIWVIDESIKEAVVEPVSSEITSFSNPAIIFSHLQDMFDVRSSVPSDGGKSMIYVMYSKSVKDVEYMNVEILNSNATITSCLVALTDGSQINIKVSSMEPTPLRQISYFQPQIKFDSSWVVTDMR